MTTQVPLPSDREDTIADRVETLRASIAELQALRITIVNNPSQTINIAGISYTFQTQSEIDAVLNPMVKEYNFLEDIQAGGEIDGTTYTNTNLLRPPYVIQEPLPFAEREQAIHTIVLPEGYEDIFETFTCMVSGIAPPNVRAYTHNIPVAYLANETAERVLLDNASVLIWNGTTRTLSTNEYGFLYAALIYKWY